ncbi:MAG: hypothetical protein ACI85L_002101 [Pseudomonadota bacterium]|jgi:hypothetical protein
MWLKVAPNIIKTFTRINHMQVSANSQLQMQAYNKTQQLKPAMEQTASPKTLQSDTVSFSQEAISAASSDNLQRGGVILDTSKPK